MALSKYYFLIGITLQITSCYADDDDAYKRVLEERTACDYHTQLTFACPTKYIVILRSAYYMKSGREGCNAQDDNLCEVQDVLHDWFMPCYRSSSCAIDVSPPATNSSVCPGYRGDSFLKVTYKCEPDMGIHVDRNVKDICDFGPRWTGSLIYLWNPNYPSFSNAADCGCTIDVSEEIELQIRVPHFEHKPEELAQLKAKNCSQAVDIQGGYTRKTLCSESNGTINTIDIDIDSDVYIHYRNPYLFSARLMVLVQVHHERNFTIACTQNFAMPPLPTLPPTTLPHPTTSNPVSTRAVPTTAPTSRTTTSRQVPSEAHRVEPAESKSKVPWPIITGVVAAVCVILVTGIAVLLFCRKQQRDKILKQKGIAEMDNFRYDNAVYMSHSQIDQRSDRSSDTGSQHYAVINSPAGAHNTAASRSSNSTISLHSDSSLPPKPGADAPRPPKPRDVSAIHPSVLQRLGFQSETGVDMGDNMNVVQEQMGAKEADPEVVQECASSENLSVKDRARLIEKKDENNSHNDNTPL